MRTKSQGKSAPKGRTGGARTGATRTSKPRASEGGAFRPDFASDKPRGKSKSFGKGKPATGGARKKRFSDSGPAPGGSRMEKKLNRGDRTREKAPKREKGPWKESAYTVSGTSQAEAPVVHSAVASSEESQGAEAPSGERLQKVLARAGIASRRKAEVMILEGQITVNGRVVTELGTRVKPTDKIKVAGKMIFTEIEPIYIAYYKPKGVISAMVDPEGRKTIGYDLRGVRERVIPVGRLDYNSEGLLLLTNDGTIADKIQRARGLARLYMVKVKGHPTERDLEVFKRGFFTAGGVVRFSDFGVEQSLKSKSWIKLEVTEGAQLDLRELLNHKGLLVDRIVRTAIGGISIQGLQPGEYRFMKRRDFEALFNG